MPTPPSPAMNSSSVDLSRNQRQFTAPHQNNTASDASQAKDENKFAKKNPFADFSTFERKVDEMKPIAPDANNEKLMEKLTKRIESNKVEPVPISNP